MSESKLSFKEMCAKFEVTPRTLRYYEYIELLSPERIGRSRFYGARECARMTLILRGRKFGFQLEELRQWLLIYDKEGTNAQMNVFIDMADRKLIELFEQQKQLAEQRRANQKAEETAKKQQETAQQEYNKANRKSPDANVIQTAVESENQGGTLPVSYTHLTLPTKRIV